MMLEHTNSYYAATRNDHTCYPALQDSVEADVAIVGGGFTGVATALCMAERGYSVVLLEQNRIAWGASGRNGGQLIGGISGQHTMSQRLGSDYDEQLWQLGWRGNEIIEQRVARYAIECDLKRGYIDAAALRRSTVPSNSAAMTAALSCWDRRKSARYSVQTTILAVWSICAAVIFIH